MVHMGQSRPDSGPSEYGTHKTVKPRYWSDGIWHIEDSQGQILVRSNEAHIRQSSPDSGSSEDGTHKTVKDRLWSE